ncbi:MAG: glycosyltransferase [Calditrichaeota bacterium]|nr:glycosyltransferase [Calditrichota bacterium]
MKPVIIIPALNESPRIEKVLNNLFKLKQDFDVIIVDAMSTDGTRENIQRLQSKHPNLKLIDQPERNGFGNGLKIGFQEAMKGDYDPIITMDGNGSHGTQYISDFLEKSHDYDLVIGSRYIDGVRVEGWRFRKLLVSKLASMYVSYVLIKPIWDFTSGFRCYRRSVLEEIDLNDLHREGYIIQIQLLHLAYKARKRVKEIPFVYRDTLDRVSKVGMQNKLKTFLYVLRYSAPVLEIFRHLVYLKKEYERFVEEYDELINPAKLKNGGQFEIKENYSVSVGVMAYNEEKLVGKCLDGLLNQELKSGHIEEIFVVSSGSTDRTNEIVREYEKKDKRIKLIVQATRMGKAAAINDFLARAKGDITIVESSDTVTEPYTVEEMIKTFSDKEVGMCGVHPVPVNDRKTFVGYSVHRLWELHHAMALDHPKCGEMIAFRNLVPRIPKYTSVDEAAIEGILNKEGFKLAYAENAILHNKGPETVRDFIKQRRRIASGHRHLAASMGHHVFTQSSGNIFGYVLKSQKWNPKHIIFMGLLISVEGYSRFMGMIDFYLRDKNPFVWDISKSTKHM